MLKSWTGYVLKEWGAWGEYKKMRAFVGEAKHKCVLKGKMQVEPYSTKFHPPRSVFHKMQWIRAEELGGVSYMQLYLHRVLTPGYHPGLECLAWLWLVQFSGICVVKGYDLQHIELLSYHLICASSITYPLSDQQVTTSCNEQYNAKWLNKHQQPPAYIPTAV